MEGDLLGLLRSCLQQVPAARLQIGGDSSGPDVRPCRWRVASDYHRLFSHARQHGDRERPHTTSPLQAPRYPTSTVAARQPLALNSQRTGLDQRPHSTPSPQNPELRRAAAACNLQPDRCCKNGQRPTRLEAQLTLGSRDRPPHANLITTAPWHAVRRPARAEPNITPKRPRGDDACPSPPPNGLASSPLPPSGIAAYFRVQPPRCWARHVIGRALAYAIHG